MDDAGPDRVWRSANVDENKDLVSRTQIERFQGAMSRRGLMGGFAGLVGMAMAAGWRPGMSRAEGLSALNILPEDLPAKQYKAAFSEIALASTWVSHGAETSKFFGDLLGVEVETFDANFLIEQQLQDMQQIAN